MLGLAPNDNRENAARRLDVNLGYELPVAGNRFIGARETGFGFSDRGRQYRSSRGLGLARRDQVSVDLSLEAMRHESANNDRKPEHEISLGLRMPW